jgi:UPF0176 protein
MFLNLATYRFVDLQDLSELKARFEAWGEQFQLKGTVLLAEEGINSFLCCTPGQFEGLQRELNLDPRLAGLDWKKSLSATQSFKRWKVKIKPEIITFKKDGIRPSQQRADSVSPVTLKRWLDQGHDDQGMPVRLLDTRNDFEIAQGTFEHALDPNIQKFSDLPAWLAEQGESLKKQRIVSFCTGGIRCEKSALYMAAQGYEHVSQLEGGILRYFEEVGIEHWRGSLFVFDDRRGVDPSLRPIKEADQVSGSEHKPSSPLPTLDASS